MWTGLSDLITVNRVWKNKNSNFVAEKPGNWVIKVNIPSNKSCVLNVMGQKGHITSVVPSPASAPSGYLRKCGTNSNWGTFYRIPDHFNKVSRSRKEQKNGHWLEETKERLNRLIWILKQKKSGKTGKIQIKSAVSLIALHPSWFPSFDQCPMVT